MDDVNLWSKDLADFDGILKEVSETLRTYTLRLNAFKDEVLKEEGHINLHDKAIENHDEAQGFEVEHKLLSDRHKIQRDEFERLKIVYYQLNLLMHTFEKGIHKINQ